MRAVHHEVVHYTGRVQGVGFRYQTLQVAKGYEVSGFVRNLPDGRVQLEVEGEEEEVASFLAEIDEQMSGFIRQSDRSGRKRSPEFSGFAIR